MGEYRGGKMKKPLFCIAAVMFFLTPLAAQTITVTSPDTGTDHVGGWCVGSTHEITWTSSGVNQPLTIALRHAGSAPDAAPALVIASGEANDGSFSWTIPASVAPGSYFIRIRTDDATVRGDGQNFTIHAAPAITVTSPNFSAWTIPEPITITWSFACGNQEKLTIALRYRDSAPDAAPVAVIATGVPAFPGVLSWKVPADVKPGIYVIRVRTDDASVVGESKPFKIPGIWLRSPNGGEEWRIGERKRISWYVWGWDETVRVELWQDGKLKGIISRGRLGRDQGIWWDKVGKLLNGVKADVSDKCKILIIREGLLVRPPPPESLYEDESDDFFSIRRLFDLHVPDHKKLN
jgi:hypothetical protein